MQTIKKVNVKVSNKTPINLINKTVKNITEEVKVITEDFYEDTEIEIENKLKKFEKNNYNNISIEDLLEYNKLITTTDFINSNLLEKMLNFYKGKENNYSAPVNALNNKNITIKEFNDFIKNTISDNYKTKDEVILAGLALSEYTLITGENFRYSSSLANRTMLEGIEEETYLDCSSFVFWSLYNGGYKWPEINENQKEEYYQIISVDNSSDSSKEYNDGIINNNFELSAWAKVNKILKSPQTNKANKGDFLLVNNESVSGRHIMMVVDSDEEGYYVLEERGEINGLILNKRPYEEIIEKGYNIVDMQEYYENSNNKK